MTEVINPYIAGNPVTGEEMFFGREDVFTFVRQTLHGQHRDQVIVLYGQRRTGKTSILYQMHRNIDPRYLCIFIDLHGLSMDSETVFLWELANQIRRVLARDHRIALPTINRADFEADPRSYLANDFLDQALQAVGDRHILLMLDEAVRLQEQVHAGKLDKAIFEYLRHLMQHYDRLNFLFSLGSGLEQMEKEYAFLFNVALYKKISFLDRQSAVELITEPVKDYYRVEPDAVERILSITSCHPYYTQLLCHSLFNRWRQQGGQTMNVSDIEPVLEEVVERGLAVLKHTWEDSTPGEKAVVAGLAAAMGEQNRRVSVADISWAWDALDVVVPRDQMAKATESLTARDVISNGDQIRFRVDLQHLWVRKYRHLEWVKEEIREQIETWPVKVTDAASAARNPVVPQGASQTAAEKPNRTRLILGSVAALLAFLILLAAIQGWPPFGERSSDEIEASSGASSPGAVVLGGEAAQVNDLLIAEGAVWAATEGGLIRWTADGRWSRISGEDIGFGDDWNQTIVPAPDGSVWIGGGGVSHIELTEDGVRFLEYFSRDDDLGLTRVYALLPESNGTVWAGGPHDHETPLSWYDGQEWGYDILSQPEDAELAADVAIWSILRDSEDDLWLGLNWDGLLRWDGENWSYWGPEAGVGGRNLEDARIRKMFQDEEGTIWVAASDRGLLRFSSESQTFEQITDLPAPVYIITQFSDGSLWAGGADWVARSDDDGETWAMVAAAEDNLGDEITDIAQDEAGRLWAGAYDGGVSVLGEDGVWQHFQR